MKSEKNVSIEEFKTISLENRQLVQIKGGGGGTGTEDILEA